MSRIPSPEGIFNIVWMFDGLLKYSKLPIKNRYTLSIVLAERHIGCSPTSYSCVALLPLGLRAVSADSRKAFLNH